MMNSLLKKRLPGILAAGVVALAVGAAGATPAAASSGELAIGPAALTVNASTSAKATTSALTRAQRRLRVRMLRNCMKRKRVRPRRLCVRRVKQRFNRLARKQRPKPAPRGRTHRVDILDPYSYSPNQLNIKANDSILWDWRYSVGREPHDVTPVSLPPGVNRNAFKSSLATGPNFTFRRQFTTPGAYSFVCSIHHLMTMNVNVSR